MVLTAFILLFLCALTVIFGSAFAEFRDNHIYNEKWDPHARFHCASYALTNIALGLFATALLVISIIYTIKPFVAVSIILIAIVDMIMLVTNLVPGVSNIAEGEKVYKNNPTSYWMTYVHLLFLIVGSCLYYFS
ncbi:MAG: hypothetical protein AAGI25_13490 [Bacteroidota bacterium]